MKRLAFSALIASALLASPAIAQQSNSGSTSSAIAIAGGNGNDGSVQRSRSRVASTAAAIAPGLTAAGVHSCAGSVSAAGGGVGFGLSIGGTYAMKGCERRANAATLMGLGQNRAALALICRDEEVMEALNQTGVVCPQQIGQVQAVAVAADPQTSARGAQGSTTAPARASRSADAWSSMEAPVRTYRGQPVVQTATPWRD